MDSWHGVLIHMELLRREKNADETLSFLPKKTIHVHQLDNVHGLWMQHKLWSVSIILLTPSCVAIPQVFWGEGRIG